MAAVSLSVVRPVCLAQEALPALPGQVSAPSAHAHGAHAVESATRHAESGCCESLHAAVLAQSIETATGIVIFNEVAEPFFAAPVLRSLAQSRAAGSRSAPGALVQVGSYYVRSARILR